MMAKIGHVEAPVLSEVVGEVEALSLPIMAMQGVKARHV